MIRSCTGCAFVIKTVTIKRPTPTEVAASITLHFDRRGRYWCEGCWSSDGGKRQRRLEKLEAVAECAQATEGERSNARQRIEEMFARNRASHENGRETKSSYRVTRSVKESSANAATSTGRVKAEAEAAAKKFDAAMATRRERIQRRRILFDERIARAEAAAKRRFGVLVRATALQFAGCLLWFVLGRFHQTGVFYSSVGAGMWLIGMWFSFRADEYRISMRAAVAFAVVLAMFAWLSMPIQQIILDLMKVAIA